MVNILIADDHALFREGLKSLFSIENDFKVIAEAGNSYEILDMVKNKQLDVILLDITLPGKSGLDLIKDIRKLNKRISILMLTGHPEDRFAFRAFRAGASGYLTKEKTFDELNKAIRKVISGGKYVSPEFGEELANEIKKQDGRPLYETLSDREMQVMRLIASGKKVIEIARILSLSKSTINTYRARILEKLKLRSNVDLTHYALNNDLL